MSENRALTIIAIMLICLLLVTATIVQVADASEKTKDKEEDKKDKTKTKTEKDKDKDEKDIHVERAIEAIESAEKAINEAERKISDAENAGLDVSDAENALRESKTLLSEARSMMNTDPQGAVSLANRAENMARLAIKLAEQASRKDATKEEQVRNYQEIIDETKGVIERARITIEEAARIGGDVSEAIQLLEQAENLLRDAESKIESDVGEAIRLATQARITAEKALRVSERVREETSTRLELMVRIREAEELMRQAQEAIRNAESKMQSTELDENSLKILNEMLGQAREMLEKAREKLSINTESARAHAEIALRLANRVSERIEEQARSQVEPMTETELNLLISEDTRGEENKLLFTNGLISMYLENKFERTLEDGTIQIEIIKERILVIGDKTLLEQVRIIEKDGKVVEEQESTEELNEPAAASILEVKENEIKITKIDHAVKVEALNRNEEMLKLRVAGPDGLGARILVIQLDADAFRAIENGDLLVLVNDAEARLADSIYQLLTNEIDEPAYVLVKTATGYQLMVYFPHFSEYIVEIRAVISRILGSLFDPRTALLATAAATIVIASVMALNMYRRYSSRGKILKLW